MIRLAVSFARARLFTFAVAGLLLAATAPAWSQSDYKPEVGMDGKDVVWVPTDQPLVQTMLNLAKVTPQDFLMDLGSGDGRTVIAAAKRGLKAHGIEYNPKMVELAKARAVAEGVADRASFEKADLFESDFSKASVITLFLLDEINERLRPRLLDLKPGTRIVSNTFTMGDWTTDESVTLPKCTSWCTAHLWIIPAKVEGTWRMGERDLRLSQTYQMLKGTLGGKPIADARMSGDRISFTADGMRFVGTVSGTKMTGTMEGHSGGWSATRR